MEIVTCECFCSKAGRLSIINKDDEIINLLSITDVLSFVSNVLPIRSTLKALDVVRRPIAVTLDTLFGEVTRLLFDNRANGLAIVDDVGSLVGSLCANEVAKIDPKNISAKLFQLDLATLFMSKILIRQEPITCSLDSPLSQLVNIMYNNKIQRVYVTDSNHKPTGIITINNVLRALKTI